VTNSVVQIGINRDKQKASKPGHYRSNRTLGLSWFISANRTGANQDNCG